MIIFADEEWAKYVFQIYLSTYKIKPENDISLSYGIKTEKASIIIFKGEKKEKKLLFDGKSIPIYHSNSKENILGDILAYYDDGTPAISHDKKSNTIFTNADLLKTSYFMLSRFEEENAPKDEWGRFQAKYSLNKDLYYPFVNEYFEILFKLFKIIYKNKNIERKKLWPNNAPYAVCLTHDIDIIYKWWLRKIFSKIFIKRDIKILLKSLGRKEYWNFENIMDLEDKYNFRSTFFFLTTKKNIEPGYNIKKLKNVIKVLNENDWEVGLHAGFYSYNDYNQLLREKEKLEKIIGKKIYGLRNHYLRFNAPHTWQIQEKVGFHYDTTLGFRDAIGFRAGYCHPYYPYDYKNDVTFKILELPMTFMDSQILSQKKCNETLDGFIKTAKVFNGLLVVNWHQCVFDNKDFPNYDNMYKLMLEKFRKDNAFVVTCNDMCLHWQNYLKNTMR